MEDIIRDILITHPEKADSAYAVIEEIKNTPSHNSIGRHVRRKHVPTVESVKQIMRRFKVTDRCSSSRP